jgi:hypothetical protein
MSFVPAALSGKDFCWVLFQTQPAPIFLAVIKKSFSYRGPQVFLQSGLEVVSNH